MVKLFAEIQLFQLGKGAIAPIAPYESATVSNACGRHFPELHHILISSVLEDYRRC